ncbi:monosaccharide ABC transporter membrane protein, CUT2 family [Sphaerochaeta associata]|uniref:ABC transporter permease n=1 Tax=Sphaerochaeta associata TaxID=1129264 RepID=A0ABY4D5P8_9SPIR|nr:ABC transporter permease [Sphaerochaeta associata]UOM49621.1 ABC transporter permease [Sphaerochaeta associata]SMP49120.1 monosaccharide ABC transporter membrane protein, CUT2 family [Sphaerochaeta associata]
MDRTKVIKFTLKNSTAVLFVLIFIMFGLIAPRFFTLKNFQNIMSNASYIGIIAVGMTFVLLTGGIDLSVGSTMYLSAVVCGKLINEFQVPVVLAVLLSLCVGLIIGMVNAFAITKLRLVPFITTLITQTVARGFGLFITRSVAVNYPDSVTLMSTSKVLGFIPLQIFIFLVVVLIAALVLNRTRYGRQLYAVGNDLEFAKKAGIKCDRLIASTYVISGLLAALGGFVTITQIGRVNAGFGSGEEFDAIAAAVLGGASLFGGIGTVFPGTVLGTVMIEMIQAGLVFANIDIYIQPIIMALIIFMAVFIDSVRTTQIHKLERRNILKA